MTAKVDLTPNGPRGRERCVSDRTEIVVILDRSGSMQDAKSDHEGGLRSFIEDQRSLPGDVRFTLIQFDDHDPCEVVYDGAMLGDVKDIALVPRGGTPLLDAIGKATSHLESRLKGLGESQVIVMVITDGYENSSREWTRDRIKQRVADLEKGGWKFLFLGANIDAFGEASQLGVQTSGAMNFANNQFGVAAMYAANSSNTRKSRMMRAQGASLNTSYQALNYTDEQRAAAMGGDVQSVSADKGPQWTSSSSQ